MYQRVFVSVLTASLLTVISGNIRAAEKPEAAGTPLDISISTILKDPWRYHGKLVRVRGTFDECVSYSCHLCESAPPFPRVEEMNKTCMGVSFVVDADLQPAGSREHEYLMWRAVRNLTERNARFATVTLEAQYDATCSGVQQPNPPDTEKGIITVCGDRATQLGGARIIRVHIRRPATAGHITAYLKDPLAAPGPEDAKELEATFRAASSAFASDGEKTPDYLFVWKELPDSWPADYGIEAVGGACVCLLKECTHIKWPRREGDVAFDIPANPYKCWSAEKAGGVWKFPLQ